MATRKVHNATIVQHGKEIVVPTGMTTAQAITVLQRKLESDEQAVNFSETFRAFPWDGAHALARVLEKRYGFFLQGETSGFFGSNPPQMISIEIGLGQVAEVPWGRVFVPPIPTSEGFLQTGSTTKDGLIAFSLHATVRRKHLPEVKAIAELIHQELRERSIYRAKAVKMRFKDDQGELLEMPEPKFMDVEGVTEADLIFPREVESAIRISVWTPIERAEEVRKLAIAAKRGILFAGDYGTGKTMAARVTAAKATRCGWTFVLCERADEFAETVRFARQYAPAVVFCEDIDRVTSGERTVSLDDILNVIDGIESKRSELMVVLTTNNIERIHPAMLRPGRLDAVIHIRRPDADAVERLIRLYAGPLIAPDEDLRPASRVLDGAIPAVVAECVQRAKLAALSHMGNDEKLRLTGKTLLEAAETMKLQLELLQPKLDREENHLELIGKHILAGIDLASKPNGKGVADAY